MVQSKCFSFFHIPLFENSDGLSQSPARDHHFLAFAKLGSSFWENLYFCFKLERSFEKGAGTYSWAQLIFTFTIAQKNKIILLLFKYHFYYLYTWIELILCAFFAFSKKKLHTSTFKVSSIECAICPNRSWIIGHV